MSTNQYRIGPRDMIRPSGGYIVRAGTPEHAALRALIERGSLPKGIHVTSAAYQSFLEPEVAPKLGKIAYEFTGPEGHGDRHWVDGV